MNGIDLFRILFGAMLVFTVIWSVAYEWRRRSGEPSKTERVLARGWLLFRRVACFLVAAFFLLVAVMGALSRSVGIAFFCLLIAGFATWVGMYGAGRRRHMLDDRKVHEERKRRYGWRW